MADRADDLTRDGPGKPVFALGLFEVEHGSPLARDQREKCLRCDDGSTAQPSHLEAASGNVAVEGRPAEARYLAGFSDAVAELRECGGIRIHWDFSG